MELKIDKAALNKQSCPQQKVALNKFVRETSLRMRCPTQDAPAGFLTS
jgi:hypothetical protein